MIIAICGLAGSGKSEVRKFFEKNGFVYIHLGVTELIIEKHGKTNEKLEREMRKRMREEQGMDVMIQIALPKIVKLLKQKKKVVIDNLYSWGEYKTLRKKYPKTFFTIAVHASPKIRHQRLEKRKFRGLDKKTALTRDYSHIEELDVGGPIVMADFHVINEGKKTDLEKQLEDMYSQL